MTMKKFKTLTVKQKIDYILFDFSWQVIFGLLFAFLIGSWIYLDYIVEQPVLRVEMIDGSAKENESAAFSEFMQARGLNNSTDVQVEMGLQLDKIPVELRSSLYTLMFCKAAEGKTDLYFWDDRDVEDALSKFDLIDLRTVLPADVLEKCRDRLIYTAPLLEGGYPCGIHLKDCQWISENGFYSDCAVGISRSANDSRLVSDFIEYIT